MSKAGVTIRSMQSALHNWPASVFGDLADDESYNALVFMRPKRYGLYHQTVKSPITFCMTAAQSVDMLTGFIRRLGPAAAQRASCGISHRTLASKKPH